MRPVTSDFTTAIAKSHSMGLLVEVLRDGLVIEEITAVTGGSVTLDAKAAIRGRLDLTLVDDGTLDLIPTLAGDSLAPYGNELRVSRGVNYPDGTSELVTLGVFRINDTDVSDGPDTLTIQIAAMDRSARIADARFEDPTTITQGVNVATQILNTIQAVYSDVVYDFAATTHTTGHMTVEEGSDRWELCQHFASNAAMELYFNGDGTLILRAEGQGAAAATLAEGVDGVLLSSSRRWTRQGTFNRVIATGENTGETAPVRGVATDDNPLSPTYYLGTFGQVPRFFVSQFFTTSQQALDTANAMLLKELGTTQSVNFGSLVMPQLEPNDVVRITRERAGIDEDHVIDAVTIPLTADQSMTGTTRATQVNT
jgi:Domain of unknown function (DUF5047)